MTGRRSLAARASRVLLVAAMAALMLSLAAVPAHAELTFSITGRGYGHGIGMSQWGAKGYADHGYKYDAILKHYYQGTTLGTRANVYVRVNLDDGKASRSNWAVVPGNEYEKLVVRDLTNNTNTLTLAMQKAADGQVIPYYVTVDNSKVSIRKQWVSATPLKTFPAGVSVTPTSDTRTTGAEPPLVWIVSPSGPSNNANIRWRGRVDFIPATSSTAKAVNRVAMENYLYGVVPRESPSSFPAEALKAQAVAARSYAWTAANNGTEIWSTTMSQVYGGHSRKSYNSTTKAYGTSAYEKSSTNSAVNATKQQVVVYGSTLVTTFFFASSGGHTANIEDVWGSTPQPYYKGVDDPYEQEAAAPTENSTGGYPYTTSWHSTLSYGEDVFSSTLRARDKDDGDTVVDGIDNDYNYTEAWPALITNVTVGRANTGHAKTVTLYWSNGATHTLSGDRFRRWFSLRSTMLFVGVSGLPAATKRYEQTESKLAFAGSWPSWKDAKASGGSYRYSSAANALANVRFKGTAVRWIGTRSTNYGKAAVYVDGVWKKTIDLYASRKYYKQLLYSQSGLTDGDHLLTVRVLRYKNAKSSGYNVAADAFDVTGGWLNWAPEQKRIQETDTKASYTGTWTSVSGSSLSGGSYKYTRATSAAVEFRFTGGIRLNWVTSTGSGYGKAYVSVDGGSPVLVDLYSASYTGQRTVWTSGVLKWGDHSVKIWPSGTKNASSKGTAVGIDAVDVIGYLVGTVSSTSVSAETTETPSAAASSALPSAPASSVAPSAPASSTGPLK